MSHGPGMHPWFLTRDGLRELVAAWDAGPFPITALSFASDVATGTPPLVVASTTLVSNLNADLLDGQHASAFAAAAHNHDHGTLTGLADDDHAQYHNDARGDARYSQLGHTHTLSDVTDSGALAAGDDAGDVPFDNSASGLTATDVQAAIDEVDNKNDSQDTNIAALLITTSGHDSEITALEERQRVHYLQGSGTIALTGSATKINVSSGALTQTDSTGAAITDWALYDSGSGFADSLRYTGSTTKTFDVWAMLRVSHTSADSKPLEGRALCYLNTGLVNGGHIYTAPTSTLNASVGQGTTCFRQAFAQNDYLNFRAAYVNTGSGASTNGATAPFGFEVILREI